MKKFITLSFAFLLVFATVTKLNATNGMPLNKNLTDRTAQTAKVIARSPISADTDQSTLSFDQKNELPKENQSTQSDHSNSNGGIYISVGALLIIILILILIL